MDSVPQGIQQSTLFSQLCVPIHCPRQSSSPGHRQPGSLPALSPFSPEQGLRALGPGSSDSGPLYSISPLL